MYIPSIADIPINGPVMIIDAETGTTYAAGPDALPPDAERLPVLSITADAGRLIITTRRPHVSPAEELRRTRGEYLRRHSAGYTPGTRRMY